jgi:hypothetical protein
MTDEARALLDGQLKSARAGIAMPNTQHCGSLVTVPSHLQAPFRCAAVDEPLSIALSQRWSRHATSLRHHEKPVQTDARDPGVTILPIGTRLNRS